MYHTDSYSFWTLLHILDPWTDLPWTHVKIYLKRRESAERKYQQEFYQFYQFLAEILNKALMDSRIQTCNWYERIHKLGKYSKTAKAFCRKSKINYFSSVDLSRKCTRNYKFVRTTFRKTRSHHQQSNHKCKNASSN